MNSPEQIYSDLAIRIKALEELSTIDLKTEMGELKKALLENPQACMLLLPEDIGLLVTSIRKVVGTAIATASTKKVKEPKAKAVKMSAQELQDALDDM